MTKKKIVLIFLIAFLLMSTLMAERITLNNGDRIEGTILSMDSQMVRIEDGNGIVLEINKDMIASIDYSSQGEPEREAQEQISGMSNSYHTQQPPAVAGPVPVSPINPHPAVHFDPAPMQSGLLDPELEARRRMVSYNDQRKNPLLAASLGIVFPGTGHFYSRRIAAGFFFLGTRAIFTGMTLYGFSKRTDPNTQNSSFNNIIVGSAGAVGFVTMMAIEAIDAYTTASDYNYNLRLKLGIDTLHENALPAFDAQY